jgi:hypothetical protein
MKYALGLVGFKKSTGSRVWVLYEQTRTHEPVGYRFMPINKPMGMKVDPNPYPNGVKTHQVSGFGFRVPITISSVEAWGGDGSRVEVRDGGDTGVQAWGGNGSRVEAWSGATAWTLWVWRRRLRARRWRLRERHGDSGRWQLQAMPNAGGGRIRGWWQRKTTTATMCAR